MENYNSSTTETQAKALPESSLGDRIREAREILGLSLEGLSRLTKSRDSEKQGISRTVLTGYEKGKFKPGTRELRILYESLKITPNWLILGRSDPERLQSKYSSEEEFEGELLKAIRKLDSDSLSGVAHLIFSAATTSDELDDHLRDFKKLTSHVIEDLGAEMDTIKKSINSIKSKREKKN